MTKLAKTVRVSTWPPVIAAAIIFMTFFSREAT
jgi:hypothetical protein